MSEPAAQHPPAYAIFQTGAELQLGSWGQMEAMGKTEKWNLAEGAVIKHMPYGLRVRVPTGEIGVVDRADIADRPITEEEWPVVG